MKQQLRFRTGSLTTLGAALIALGVAVHVHAASVSTNGLVLVDATHPEDYNPSMVNITGTGGNNGVAAAFDNDFSSANSRWLVKSSTCWAAYEFEVPTVINGYGVWNGDSQYNPAERAPKDFQFSGSSDGVTWTTLDTQTGETGWSRAEMRFYRFNNATAYKHYKFEVSANNGNEYTQIHELEFYSIPLSGNLEISGHPAEYGRANPAYGTLANVAGQTIDLSVQSAWTNAAETSEAYCTGWKVYTNNLVDAVWTLVGQGSGNAVSFTHPNMYSRFAWQFAVSNAVVVSADTNGTASGTGWYGFDQTVTATATPDAGYQFGRWIGEVPTGMEKVNPLQFTADTPRSITALFQPEGMDELVQYVSTNGNDAADGYTPATARKTIAAAVQCLDNYGEEGGTVHVADGVYPVSSPTTVANPIRIISQSGDPSRAMVSNTKGAGWNNQNQRVFILDHSDAVLSGLTIANGQVEQCPGGNVWIKTGGGTVTNCVLDKGYARNYFGTGAGIRMEAGLLTHSILSENTIQQNGEGKGAAIHASGGARVSNCPVMANRNGLNTHAVLLSGATMENCTVVDNAVTTNGTWAAVSANSSSSVINTVIAGTTFQQTGAPGRNWSGTASVFQNCATDDAAPINANCFVGTPQTFFRDYAAGDYRPLEALIDTGVEVANPPAVDLAGNPRVQGSRIDIGAYEGRPTCTTLIIR
ncbi:MAG: InlB B-repeat-containing protein [Kiritimatiellia bacterium]|jgi:hypothetical protein